jgi:hypothetical protein
MLVSLRCVRAPAPTATTNAFRVLHDGYMRTSNVPLNSNFGDAHIVGDFGVEVFESVCKIDLSRPPADGVQYGCELIQAPLG